MEIRKGSHSAESCWINLIQSCIENCGNNDHMEKFVVNNKYRNYVCNRNHTCALLLLNKRLKNSEFVVQIRTQGIRTKPGHGKRSNHKSKIHSRRNKENSSGYQTDSRET